MAKRMRDYGFTVGRLSPGPRNAITDVPGVSVGHTTLNSRTGYEDHVCTGVTAILPHQGNLYVDKVPAAAYVINGFGKTTGLVQVEELGEIEAPIMLTNTFSVPAVTEGTLQYMLSEHKEIGDTSGSLNIVVGECNDSYLNDMRGLHVRPQHAVDAIHKALSQGAAGQDGTVAEGSIGAGTGMRCFGWKGGIGTASRRIRTNNESFTIGTLVLTNFGDPADLTMLGAPVGQKLSPPSPEHSSTPRGEAKEQPGAGQAPETRQDGSVVVIIGTDAPLNSRQLRRLAKRVPFGLARTGSIAHHGSGDIVIAFSTSGTSERTSARTSPQERRLAAIADANESEFISDYFRGVVETTEEAVLNSLTANETISGRGSRTLRCLPMDHAAKLLNLYLNSFN